MTHVTCRLTAKNQNQLRNCTLGNRVWATFTDVWPVLCRRPYVRQPSLKTPRRTKTTSCEPSEPRSLVPQSLASLHSLHPACTHGPTVIKTIQHNELHCRLCPRHPDDQLWTFWASFTSASVARFTACTRGPTVIKSIQHNELYWRLCPQEPAVNLLSLVH